LVVFFPKEKILMKFKILLFLDVMVMVPGVVAVVVVKEERQEDITAVDTTVVRQEEEEEEILTSDSVRISVKVIMKATVVKGTRETKETKDHTTTVVKVGNKDIMAAIRSFLHLIVLTNVWQILSRIGNVAEVHAVVSVV